MYLTYYEQIRIANENKKAFILGMICGCGLGLMMACYMVLQF